MATHGVTAGRAAFEAFHKFYAMQPGPDWADRLPHTPWDEMTDANREAWEVSVDAAMLLIRKFTAEHGEKAAHDLFGVALVDDD